MQEWEKYTVSVKSTWHPVGRSHWFGPVLFEQRVNGRATGLSFTVSRRVYWLIRMIGAGMRWKLPLVGRIYRRIVVEYRWVLVGKRGRA